MKIGSRQLGILFATAIALATPSGPAGAERVRVVVDGVKGNLRRNVFGVLQIDDAGNTSEAQIRHLHSRATEQIERALQPFGYYRVLVRSALTNEGKGWVARYEIIPGPAVKLDTVDVRVTGQGSDDEQFYRLVSRFPLHTGATLIDPTYVTAKQQFVEQAYRSGYLDAVWDTAIVAVDLERYGATLRLHLDTGEQFRFGDVRFQQDFMRPDFVQRFNHIPKGEAFDYSRLLKLQEALLASPYFRGVELVLRRDLAEGLEVPVDVRLLPNEPRRFTGGLGFGTDEGASIQAGFDLRRLNGRGHRAGIDGKYSQIERSALARYEVPWTDPATDALTFGVGYAYERPTSTISRREIASVALQRLIGTWTRTYGLEFNRDRFRVGFEERTSWFLMPFATWNYLRADSRIFTSRGLKLDFKARGAAEGVLSNASFFRVEAHAKSIQTPIRQTRLIARGSVGTTWANDFAPLSPSLRFFAGGAQSVRGYAYNSLGPRDAAGLVTGGPHLMFASAEIDHRVFQKWLIAGFYDTGGALFRRGDPLKDAAGLGIRWISPVGPARFDLATPLHEPGQRYQFFITLGPDL